MGKLSDTGMDWCMYFQDSKITPSLRNKLSIVAGMGESEDDIMDDLDQFGGGLSGQWSRTGCSVVKSCENPPLST